MTNPNGRELIQTCMSLRTQEQQQTFLMSLTPEEREAIVAEVRVVFERTGMTFQNVAKQIVEAWRRAWESLPEQTRAELEKAAQKQEGGAT